MAAFVNLRQSCLKVIDRLPPIPGATGRLMAMFAKRDLDVKHVVGVVDGDPVLAGRVLALANSGAFGRRRNIDSVKHAVAFVSVSTIRRSAVSWALGSVFRRFNTPETAAWSTNRFMMHSDNTATLCDIFCDHLPVQNSEAAYMAGLMHDIGKLVIVTANADALGEVLDFNRLTGTPMIDAERELLGITHAEISGMVAERWHLPDAIGDAVYRHHTPEPDSGSMVPLSLVVANANSIVNSLGLGIVPGKAGNFEFEWPGRDYEAALESFRFTLAPPKDAEVPEMIVAAS